MERAHRRKWVIRNEGYETELAGQLNCSRAFATVLAARGIDSAEKLRQFDMDCFDFDEFFKDPFLLTDMDRAVARIEKAMAEGEKIAVFGDYDADGITSTAMLVSYLRSRGADCIFYLPDRINDGYGMNNAALDYLKSKGSRLIITVDNGISAIEESEYLRELGVDLVITDHHQPLDALPCAEAVVNPHRRDDNSANGNLCGAGVCLKLITALEKNNREKIFRRYAELAAIGSIADLVELSGENRAVVKAGLELLSKTSNPGLKALLCKTGLYGKKITSQNIGYIIAPRLNALGRYGLAEYGVKLLLTQSESEAEEIVSLMEEKNIQRQSEEQKITQQVESIINSDKSYRRDRVLVVWAEGLNHGLVGLTASKLVDRYLKPAIVLGIESDEARGSGRSISGFNLHKALSECGDLLIQFGGHPMAGGLTISRDKLELFRERINAYADSLPEPMESVLNIDCYLYAEDIRNELVEELSRLEPYGVSNPQPVFAIRELRINGIIPLSSGAHLKLIVEDKAGRSLEILFFERRADLFCYRQGDMVDICFCLTLNEYKGRVEPCLIGRELRPAGIIEKDIWEGYNIYMDFIRGKPLDSETACRLKPDREFLGRIYRLLRQLSGRLVSIDYLSLVLNEPSTAKILISLDVFEELGLVELDKRGPDVYARVLNTAKVSLENSAILDRLVNPAVTR